MLSGLLALNRLYPKRVAVRTFRKQSLNGHTPLLWRETRSAHSEVSYALFRRELLGDASYSLYAS